MDIVNYITNNFKLLEEYFIHQNLKKNSIRLYFYAYTKINKNILNFDNFNNDKLTHQQIKDSINSLECNNSRKNLLNGYIKVLLATNEILILNNIVIMSVINKLLLDYNKISRVIDNNKIFRKPNDSEIKNISKFEEKNIKCYQDLINFGFNKLNDLYNNPDNVNNIIINVKYLLLNLYSLYPLRQQDFINSKIIEEETNENKDFNYFNMTTNTLYIHDYKTSSHYGDRIITYEPIITFILKNRILNNRSDYLNLLNMTSANVSTILSELLEINKPIQTLRKLYISDMYKNNKSGKEIKIICHILGHGPSVSFQQYNKFSEIADDEEKDIYL